jgi:hypothetical protein
LLHSIKVAGSICGSQVAYFLSTESTLVEVPFGLDDG